MPFLEDLFSMGQLGGASLPGGMEDDDPLGLGETQSAPPMPRVAAPARVNQRTADEIIRLYDSLGGRVKPRVRDRLGAIISGTLMGAGTQGRGDDPSSIFRAAATGFGGAQGYIEAESEKARQRAGQQLAWILQNDRNQMTNDLNQYKAATEREKVATERERQGYYSKKLDSERDKGRYHTLPQGSVLYDSLTGEQIGNSQAKNVQEKFDVYKKLFPGLSERDLAAVFTGNAPVRPQPAVPPVNPNWQLIGTIYQATEAMSKLDLSTPDGRAENIRLNQVRQNALNTLKDVAKASKLPPAAKPARPPSPRENIAGRRDAFEDWISKELAARGGDSIKLGADIKSGTLPVPPQFAIHYPAWAATQGGIGADVFDSKIGKAIKDANKPREKSAAQEDAEIMADAIKAMKGELKGKGK